MAVPIILLAMISGGVACIVYAIGWALGEDRLLVIAGAGLIALAFMYRWAIFSFPKWLDAKEEAEQKVKEEARK